jgi:hypothetical protein
MSQANPIRLNAWILTLEARGPAAVDPGPFIELVQRQLRSRRIHKPAWLGLVDHESWTEEALLDLCGCLYESFLIDMLPTYVAAAAIRDITGLVIQKIGWTFTDLQRKADPSGYAVFKNVEAACIELVQKRALVIEGRRKQVQPRPVNQSQLRSPQAPGPTLDLDRDELRRRLAAQPGWQELCGRMCTKSPKQSAEFSRILERMLAVGPQRFRLGDLVDAAKCECCPDVVSDRPIEEIAARGDAGDLPDLRAYEGELRCAIDKEVSQAERRERMQDLVTHSLESWPKTHALPDAREHGHRHLLSKTTAYEDIHILHRCLNRVLNGD